MNRCMFVIAMSLLSVIACPQAIFAQVKIKYDEITVVLLREAVQKELANDTTQAMFGGKVEPKVSELQLALGAGAAPHKLTWPIKTTSQFVASDESSLKEAVKQVLRTAVGQYLLESPDATKFDEQVIAKAVIQFGETDQDREPTACECPCSECCSSAYVVFGCRLRLFLRRGCSIGSECVASATNTCRSLVTSDVARGGVIGAQSVLPENFVERVLMAMRGGRDATANARFALAANQSSDDNSQPRPEYAATLLGEGCHAFWQKDLKKAQERLELAIAAHGEDARSWYYLAMTRMLQGDEDAAVALYAKAVQLHREGKPGPAIIGKSLERVQGELRLALEDARSRALRSLTTPNENERPKKVATR